MPIGARIILRPTGAAFEPRAGCAVSIEAAKTGPGMLWIHQAGENPLGFILPIRRQLHVVVGLEAPINAKGPLESPERGCERDSHAQPQHFSESHRTT